MKKVYIAPCTEVHTAAPSQMILAVSKFSTVSDTQSITPVEEEYDGDFCVKSSGSGPDWEW